MANITTTARPLDDDIEDFEVRIRVNPERTPELDSQGATRAPEDKRPLADRYEVRFDLHTERSDDPEARDKHVISWMPLDDEQFTTPLWTAGDAAKLRDLMEKFHEFVVSKVV